MARRKFGEFSEEELSFLYTKVEKSRQLKEKSRIDLSVTDMIGYEFETDIEKKVLNNLKLKIIESLLNCTDFQFTETQELIIYDSVDESDKDYRNKLNYMGLEILNKEKSRLKRIAKKNTRFVLVEKYIKKIYKKKKSNIPIAANINVFLANMFPYQDENPYDEENPYFDFY